MQARDEIKAWLKKTGRTRTWLADELMVTINTVNGWMSNRDIPAAKLDRIRELMGVVATPQVSESAARAARDAGLIRSVSVTFIADEYELILEAARDSGKTVEEYILESALKECGNPEGVRATEQNAAG